MSKLKIVIIGILVANKTLSSSQYLDRIWTEKQKNKLSAVHQNKMELQMLIVFTLPINPLHASVALIKKPVKNQNI